MFRFFISVSSTLTIFLFEFGFFFLDTGIVAKCSEARHSVQLVFIMSVIESEYLIQKFLHLHQILTLHCFLLLLAATHNANIKITKKTVESEICDCIDGQERCLIDLCLSLHFSLFLQSGS